MSEKPEIKQTLNCSYSNPNFEGYESETCYLSRNNKEKLNNQVCNVVNLQKNW